MAGLRDKPYYNHKHTFFSTSVTHTGHNFTCCFTFYSR